jgi:hypothetical protein
LASAKRVFCRHGQLSRFAVFSVLRALGGAAVLQSRGCSTKALFFVNSWHLHFHRLVHQHPHPHGTVEERVFGMEMEVNEMIAFHLLPVLSGKKFVGKFA